LVVVELQGPAAALAALEELASDDRLAECQPYWAARAELLTKIGAQDDARHADKLAIGLKRDPATRRFLQNRLASLSKPTPSSRY
jgi:RNA polymerase sigma-70 factor (ECF subfamily)